mgnify:FL=1
MLSGGQKQRVAIARALASDPKILLCDEATSALDPQTTASILSLLKEINEKLGITIVIITHQMSVIREICSHVAIIEHGVLVEDGLVEDIFSHPKSKAAKELILRDQPGNNNAPLANAVQERMQGDKKIRIVFSENSAFEPVIANMILQFKTPVNILRADTKNVGGVAKGEMILGLPEDRHLQVDIEEYLKEGRLAEIKVEDLCLERNLNLVYHPHKVWNDPLRDFMDIVRWYGHDEIRAMKTTEGMFHGQTDTNTLLL